MPKNGPATSNVPRNSARDIQPSRGSPSLLAFFFTTWKPGVLKEDFPQLLRTVSVVAVRGGAHLAASAHCNSTITHFKLVHGSPLGYSGVGIILPSSTSLIAHRPRGSCPRFDSTH